MPNKYKSPELEIISLDNDAGFDSEEIDIMPASVPADGE